MKSICNCCTKFIKDPATAKHRDNEINVIIITMSHSHWPLRIGIDDIKFSIPIRLKSNAIIIIFFLCRRCDLDNILPVVFFMSLVHSLHFSFTFSFSLSGSLVDPLNRIRNVIDCELNDVIYNVWLSFICSYVIKSIIKVSQSIE